MKSPNKNIAHQLFETKLLLLCALYALSSYTSVEAGKGKGNYFLIYCKLILSYILSRLHPANHTIELKAVVRVT